jgi:hypothetical protein
MAKTIGIFLAGQNGDVLTASSVLKYREELWPDSKIVWFIEDRNRDLLAHHENLELRTFPRGYGYPERCLEENRKPNEPLWEDWSPLVDQNNRLNLSLKTAFESLADIDEGYFPAPHQLEPIQRHGLTYPECSQKIFGCGGKEWHPVIEFSDGERKEIMEFLSPLKGKRIFIETFAGSGQSSLDTHMVLGIIDECKKQWGKCSFIFTSHKFLRGNEEFPLYLQGREDIVFAGYFSVRECGLLASYTDLMISVSSGITCAASAWDLTPPPILQFTGSETCGTRLLANGPFEMVTADDKSLEQAKKEFFDKLNEMLIKYE